MVYQEFHLNCAQGRAPQSTRSHPVWELQDELNIDKFQVKYVEIPLSYFNVPNTTWTYQLQYFDVLFREWAVFTYVNTVPKGAYTGAEFAAMLQASLYATTCATQYFSAASPTDDSIGAPVVPTQPLVNAPAFTDLAANELVTITLNVDGHIEVYTDAQVHADIELEYGGLSWSFKQGVILWGTVLARLLNRSEYDTNPTRTWVPPETTVTSFYPLRLVPNYLYLHSNLMSGSTYGANSRTVGGFSMPTVMAKIPIDQAYVTEQTLPWFNKDLQPAFMFNGNGATYNHIEMWFTDEFGIEIEFNNQIWSATLAVLYRE